MKQLLAILLFAFLPGLSAQADVSVVTSTTDLAYLAKQVGGDLVRVNSIAGANADLHHIEVRPSYMVKVANADLALKVGMELDMWIDRIIDGSRNGRLTVVDCSKYVEPLEVPTFKVDASHGDLHRFGNPHYWTAPKQIPAIVRAIEEGLANVDPGHSAQFSENAKAFLESLNKSVDELSNLRERLNGLKVIYYHNSWPYFNEFAGITAADFIEPYPGIPPTPNHIRELIDLVKAEGIKVIAVEPYFDRRVPDKIADATGAKVVVLGPSIDDDGETSYADYLRHNMQTILGANQ